MSLRGSASRWSVVAVGVLLVGASLGQLAWDAEHLATDGPEVAFPLACGLGTLALGLYLREQGYDGRRTRVVAAGGVAGFTTFALIAAWLLYVMRLEGTPPSEPMTVVLNAAGFGTLGTALLSAAYVSMRDQRAALERQRARLRRANDQLRRQNERLEAFADTVAHDLRSPLNVAAGRLELSRQNGDPEELDTAADALDRAEAIIEDMLAVARRGQTVDETEPVDLASLARAAWGSVQTGDALLEVDSTALVAADESRLRQVFENLFRNAVDHGGDAVSAVRVGALDSTGFFVEDDGPGIPPDERERVFDSGVSTDPDGTGFGLAIVAAIADAHGWTVEVTEGREGGARFEVTGVEVDRERRVGG